MSHGDAPRQRPGRIVVKVGSSLLIDAAGEGARADLAGEPGRRHRRAARRGQAGRRRLLGRGRARPRPSRPEALGPARPQAGRRRRRPAPADAGLGAGACAASGSRPRSCCSPIDDTERRRRWLNARATIEVLLAQGALPVINENDSVATEELRYGDNDRLSARVAQMMQRDLLILLSDVDGLYTADPGRRPGAPRTSRIVDAIDRRDRGAGRRTRPSRASARAACAPSSPPRASPAAPAARRSSPRAARIIRCRRASANGRTSDLVAATGSPARAYKQWIAGTLAPGRQRCRSTRARSQALAGRQEPASRPASSRSTASSSAASASRILDRDGPRGRARHQRLHVGRSASDPAAAPARDIAARLGYGGPGRARSIATIWCWL